jgi:hypothetical protein
MRIDRRSQMINGRNKGYHLAAVALAAAFIGLSCDTGGGGGGGTTYTISGVAAKGAAVANAPVVLKDTNGSTMNTTTDANGAYSIDATTGLVPPILVQVDTGGGNFLYSYCGEFTGATTTVTIHPYTDLIVRSYYVASGVTNTDALFAGLTSTTDIPSIEEVEIIEGAIERILTIWQEQEGLTPANFDLFSTPFNADSSGFDAILDYTTITIDEVAGTASVTIDDLDSATSSQVTSVTLDSTAGTLTAHTVVTAPGGEESTYSSEVGCVITDDLSTVVDEIDAMFASFVATVNSAGYLLAATHIVSYYHTSYLDEGMGRAMKTGITAMELRGMTIDSLTVSSMVDYDQANAVVRVTGRYAFGIQELITDFYLKQETGAWKFCGNRRAQMIIGGASLSRTITSAGTTTERQLEMVLINLSHTTTPITALVLNGSTYTNYNMMPSESAGTWTVESAPGTTDSYDYAWYGMLDFPGTLPPSSTVLTFGVTTAGGTVQLTQNTGPWSTEDLGLNSTAGHTLATILGTQITFNWNLPMSYTPGMILADIEIVGASGDDHIGPTTETTTSAVFDVPATYDFGSGAEAVTSVEFKLIVRGSHGEASMFCWEFDL